MTTFVKSEIEGGWIISHTRHIDDRGWFQELFKTSLVKQETGINFQPCQINVSRSLQGVIRGIHYSIAPTGQAKYVSVLEGEIDDYIIDVRRNSPTFGKWQRVQLTADSGRSVLLASNLAHAFQVTSMTATVCYAVTAEFDPISEKAIQPNCKTLQINWNNSVKQLLSEKDRLAPSLHEQIDNDCLPKI